MNINLLVQFIGLIDELTHRNELIAEFERLIELYGFEYYGVIRQVRLSDDPMDLVLSGRWPDRWPEIYIRKKYIIIDPTILYMGQARGGFRWRDTVAAFRTNPHRKRMERMIVDARNHGLEDGYIFPVHARRGLVGNITLGGKPVDLHPIEMGLFDCVAKKMFWKLQNADGTEKPDVDVNLTRREMEALGHLADGMTSHEIARVLSISNHTVDWYMTGIQEKLNAKNRHHAVALSFRLGLIS
ncbi:LuxR family transcriptional regulator [Mycoplana sp. BE70]|uniref:LuxR family transcriptional regulator n=1 Tax=Mycoplana sp. BE70 TaxID=2817775 RepID=UPI00285DC9B3|nr:LuxR family transcriptional regulator [Mycoplana sp. BE70]MDR6755705.1 LuxR family transcriptional regulator [Mycoplana sp. BE70]